MQLESLLKQADPNTTNRLVYALADTSYGECCVDDVTASHAANNDCIVHFGHSCLSSDNQQQNGKKIFYVLPKTGTNENRINDSLNQAFQLVREQIILHDDNI